jgi:hypothetical protein
MWRLFAAVFSIASAWKDAAQAFVAIYFLITRGWPSSLRYTTTAFISEIVFRERLIFFYDCRAVWNNSP